MNNILHSNEIHYLIKTFQRIFIGRYLHFSIKDSNDTKYVF